MTDPRVIAVVATLRQCADIDFAAGLEEAAAWKYEVAKQIENSSVDDWWACPLCEEVVCDEGCALEPVRREREVAP